MRIFTILILLLSHSICYSHDQFYKNEYCVKDDWTTLDYTYYYKCPELWVLNGSHCRVPNFPLDIPLKLTFEEIGSIKAKQHGYQSSELVHKCYQMYEYKNKDLGTVVYYILFFKFYENIR